MSIFYYDLCGWLTSDIIENRSTQIPPPEFKYTRVLNKPYPNWTGNQWKLIPYFIIEVGGGSPVSQKYNIPIIEFVLRFTQDERIAIRSNTDPKVVDFNYILDKSSNIDLNSELIISSINYLKELNIITEERVGQILNKGI